MQLQKLKLKLQLELVVELVLQLQTPVDAPYGIDNLQLLPASLCPLNNEIFMSLSLSLFLSPVLMETINRILYL